MWVLLKKISLDTVNLNVSWPIVRMGAVGNQ